MDKPLRFRPIPNRLMNWTAILVVAVVIVAIVIFKLAGQVSSKDAGGYLSEGAMVIDVRSAGEYASGHLPQAVNIPLDEVEAVVPVKVPDKNRTLLLHCASGMRSGVAAKKLRKLGYTKVFNLGSYGRAESIVKGAAGNAG